MSHEKENVSDSLGSYHVQNKQKFLETEISRILYIFERCLVRISCLRYSIHTYFLISNSVPYYCTVSSRFFSCSSPVFEKSKASKKSNVSQQIHEGQPKPKPKKSELRRVSIASINIKKSLAYIFSCITCNLWVTCQINR